MSADIIDISPEPATEVVEAELVTVDTALTPYIDNIQRLEAMVRTYGAYAAAAAVLQVGDADTKKHAVALIRKMKGDKKDVDAFFTPIKRSIDRVKRTALDMEAHVTQLLDGPIAVINGRVLDYDRRVKEEQERRRKQLEDAERERLRLAEAERQKVAQAAAEEAALLADVFDQEPVAMPVVAALSEQTIHELAAAAVSEVVAEPEKVEGQYYVPVTHVSYDDLDALIDAVIAGTVPREALTFNESFIGKQAKAMGEALGYPGITVTVTQAPRYRSA